MSQTGIILLIVSAMVGVTLSVLFRRYVDRRAAKRPTPPAAPISRQERRRREREAEKRGR